MSDLVRRLVASTLIGAGVAGCCAEPAPSTSSWPSGAPSPVLPSNPTAEAARASTPLDGPTPQSLLDGHAAQLARMPTLVSAGVVEVVWHDESGRHFEQGDVDLRFRAPHDASFRVSKVGETFLMVGANERTWWWFEGWTKPTRLTFGRRSADDAGGVAEHAPAADAGSRTDPLARPEAEELMALFGLRPLGRAAGWADSARVDAGSDPGSPARPAQGGDRAERVVALDPRASLFSLPAQATFARSQLQGDAGWFLTGLEVLRDDGTPIVTARFDDHRRVERRDAPPGDWPVIAARMRVTLSARGDRPGAEWMIVLDRPSATGERIVDRLFDPAAVRAALRPTEVEGEELLVP